MTNVNHKIPSIDNRVVCVVDIEKPHLAALISSYFARDEHYFPLFTFPRVKTKASEVHEDGSDGYVSAIIGSEAGVLINNSLAKMTGYERIIYAGLAANQKSYLKKHRLTKNVIEIHSEDDVARLLKPFVGDDEEFIECPRAEYLEGLSVACQLGVPLRFNEDATLKTPETNAESIVVTEGSDKAAVGPVVAINYATSIGAKVELVEAIEEDERYKYETLLNQWKLTGKDEYLAEVNEAISSRVGHINFSNYRHATFFTSGLPYSLLVGDVLPCGHVKLGLRADLFVCNSIGVETGDRFTSAVVFSPQFFESEISGEETGIVQSYFSKLSYYVRMILGDDATHSSLDFHGHHFPYDYMHICSHGGGTSGYSVTVDFTDRYGDEHVLEYDEVVSFSPVPGEENILVTAKEIFRKFDGFDWMSEELRAQNIPNEVFEDMRKKASLSAQSSSDTYRTPKEHIPDAAVIECIDGCHQAAFRSLASHTSPIVFNNSCSSWGQTGTFFISAGGRGYIGTLWKVDNDVAVSASADFYSQLETSTISEALFYANSRIEKEGQKNIYLYWGLHFTTISLPAVSLEESYKSVFKALVSALRGWMEHAAKTPVSEVRRNSQRAAESILNELLKNFEFEKSVSSQNIELPDNLVQGVSDAPAFVDQEQTYEKYRDSLKARGMAVTEPDNR